MKERPILFNAEMVIAILDGVKTQTRRVIKPQPANDEDGGFWYTGTKNRRLHYGSERHVRKGLAIDFCPYGQVGDRLWVRETFRLYDGDGDSKPGMSVDYLADHDVKAKGQKWKPSIYMPRWASRITLEIECVRLERVQEISENDALAEGYMGIPDNLSHTYDPVCKTATKWFASLWDSINAKRGFSWDSNPWVWVITFKTKDLPDLVTEWKLKEDE